MPEFLQQLLSVCQDDDVSSDDHVTVMMSTLEEAGLRQASTAGHDASSLQLKQLNSTWNGDTVLHTAAVNGCSGLIPILMQYGANPAVKNDSGHTPYLVAKDKEVRDSFRRFMASFPTAYDYEHAHIPSPLTQEMELERSRKEAEKRKEKKKARKQKEKVVSICHGLLTLVVMTTL